MPLTRREDPVEFALNATNLIRDTINATLPNFVKVLEGYNNERFPFRVRMCFDDVPDERQLLETDSKGNGHLDTIFRLNVRGRLRKALHWGNSIEIDVYAAGRKLLATPPPKEEGFVMLDGAPSLDTKAPTRWYDALRRRYWYAVPEDRCYERCTFLEKLRKSNSGDKDDMSKACDKLVTNVDAFAASNENTLRGYCVQQLVFCCWS